MLRDDVRFLGFNPAWSIIVTRRGCHEGDKRKGIGSGWEIEIKKSTRILLPSGREIEKREKRGKLIILRR